MKLSASTIVSDYVFLSEISNEHLESMVVQKLGHNLAGEIIKHKIKSIIIKRERPDYSYIAGGLEYHLNCFLLSEKEWNEYQELKKFREEMKKFVGS